LNGAWIIIDEQYVRLRCCFGVEFFHKREFNPNVALTSAPFVSQSKDVSSSWHITCRSSRCVTLRGIFLTVEVPVRRWRLRKAWLKFEAERPFM
jgi:hypothetical protein